LATAGVAGCQRFLDESTGVLERAHLSVDPRLDLLESPALRSAGCSVAVVSRERTDYLVDREAQLLELAGQPNPFDISLDERAVATGGAGSRSQDTATFVEPDRVDRDPDDLGEIADLHGAIAHRTLPLQLTTAGPRIDLDSGP